MTDRYAVFGNPIDHSRSPLLHRLFAEQTGEDIDYGRQRVPEGGFRTAADRFFGSGGKGLNVTVPFKGDAFDYASVLTDRARLAGAVNTLTLQPDGDVRGDNTDGAGLLRDITVNLGWPLRGRSILVLGAGGAVRGVLGPLLGQQPRDMVIANRTVDKAVRLAVDFADCGVLRGCGFEELAGQCYDLILNGTSASLAGDLPPLPAGVLANGGHCYDMMYGSSPTAFVEWGLAAGGVVADGLGMLVEQGAEAFFIWRGVRPDTRPVLDALRASLSK